MRDIDAVSKTIKGKALFISDTHLGNKMSKSERLLELLRKTDTEEIYLVGDIIDFFCFRRNLSWSRTDEAVAHKLVKLARDKKVTYVVGNHDAVLLPYVGDDFAGIRIEREVAYTGTDGNAYLIFHGDVLDRAVAKQRWVQLVGAFFYDLSLEINERNLWLRKKLGLKPWSFSMWAKSTAKQAVNAMDNFQEAALNYAHERGYSGAITGHIHVPKVEGLYVNCGDWVENCTAVVDKGGSMHLVRGTD
jgi:UDP-2,3-diacylglucosamine pyrophosphatase LpxH